ncbi:hypothetical protein ACFWBF_18260 [Streptomyces sp. NPDC060028]|uniref:hypothetical protein n=1 Tax=Streptomyces sp. NPDC060028 TaxID=3347041 RepID=UPI0036C099B1
MSPAPNERDRVRAAMDRILAGTPERSNGALTIVAHEFYGHAKARSRTRSWTVEVRVS